MTTLIIAEKPSVARDIARVVGARERREGFLEGAGHRVAWCVGHLVELAPPEAYDPAWKAWRAETLPMLPDRFLLQPRKGGTKQLGVLRKLLKERDVTRVINACDAGREGELIFRYVWEVVFGDRRGPPVARLWIASLTDAAIREGLARLKPASSVEPLAAAARCRSEADWLVGLNATRAMTLLGRRSGGDALLSVGRVQTPTLALLTAREDAIDAFVPEPFWQVEATFAAPPGAPARDAMTWPGRWHDGDTDRLTGPDGKARAEAIAAAVRGAPARVVEVHREEVAERAHALFDLTALQKLANQRFGLSADRTLKAAQSLYEEHKAITYPRTDSRFITADIAPTLPGLLAAQAGAPWDEAVRAATALGSRPQRKVVDDAEVGDHHAILPTGKVPDLARLSPDARRVYELVARRFVAVFLPPARFDKRRIETAAGGHLFKSEGRTRIEIGWHLAEPPPPAKDAPPMLPDVREGAAATTREATVRESRTQPPKRFTEATLLGAMEHAGKDLDDDALRRAMRESGLGTPATRAAIIETLLTRDFIRRDGKTLVPTAQGRALIAALPVPALRSAELTGAWEARLSRMAEGRDDPADFMAKIRAFTAEVVRAMGAAGPSSAIGAAKADAEVLGRCPVCGEAVTKGRSAYTCARGRACTFVIHGRIAGKKVSDGLVKLLLWKRRSSVLKGFRSKAGKPFSAALVLDDEGAVRLDFGDGAKASERPARDCAESAPARPPRSPSKARSEPDPRPRCPLCREGRVIAGRQAWGCSRWREGCRFVVAFQHGDTRLPDDEADRLFRKGQTRLMAGLAEGSRARLVLDLAAADFVRIDRGKR